MVDTIQSKGDYMVHQTQKNLVAELQAYLAQLDQLVVDRWERRKLERGLLACGIPQVEMENMNLKFIQKTRKHHPSDIHQIWLTSAHHFETREKLKIVIPPFLACITTAIILHELSNLSREPTNFLLSALRVIVVSSCCYIMQTCGAKYNRHSIRAKVLEILKVDKWPNDIWTASQAIGLEPDLQIYACCIRCHVLYPQGQDGHYPNHCSHREMIGSQPCGAPLTEVSQVVGIPEALKTFSYQSMKAWLGCILSCPGIEKAMAETTSRRQQAIFSTHMKPLGSRAHQRCLGHQSVSFIQGPWWSTLARCTSR